MHDNETTRGLSRKPPSRRKTAAEKLELLLQRQRRNQARINEIEASLKSKDRKLEARCKIIIGGAVLSHATIDPAFAVTLRNVLKRAVVREADKAALKDWLDMD